MHIITAGKRDLANHQWEQNSGINEAPARGERQKNEKEKKVIQNGSRNGNVRIKRGK